MAPKLLMHALLDTVMVGACNSSPYKSLSKRYIITKNGFPFSATIKLDLFLLVTNGAEIQLLNIKGSNKMDTISIHRRVDSENNPAIDLYLPKKYIYWASTVDAKICRGTLENDRKFSTDRNNSS